jgi:hypothetical protein
MQYSRKSYCIFDVLGLIGGILCAFTPLFDLIIGPISEFDFNLKIIQKLFLAKTKEENVFKQTKNIKNERNTENL